jgi:tetratricopeptide (TPR) repeat protein
MGRYQDAASAFEEYARVRPLEANPHDSLGELHLLMGEPERALEHYGRALSLNPGFHFSIRGRVWADAMLGRYDDALAELDRFEDLDERSLPLLDRHFMPALVLSRIGRFREARTQIEAGLDLAARGGNSQAALLLISAWIHLERGESAHAREAAERALSESSRFASSRDFEFLSRLFAGVSEARSGRTEAARAHLSAMKSPASMTEAWYREALSGEIALAEGDPAAAERAFAAGEPDRKMWFNFGRLALTAFANSLPFRDGRARAAEARGDREAAIEMYQRLVSPDLSSQWTGILEPRFILELARLYDRVDRKDQALREYRRFLELWKDADADLPELQEAKAALAR